MAFMPMTPVKRKILPIQKSMVPRSQTPAAQAELKKRRMEMELKKKRKLTTKNQFAGVTPSFNENTGTYNKRAKQYKVLGRFGGQ